MCSDCAVSRLVCGWSHPSGVWYLIAWIDRPKERVTLSWYHGTSRPNKTRARLKHRTLLLCKINLTQHKPTREKGKKRNSNELCWYWSSGGLYSLEDSAQRRGRRWRWASLSWLYVPGDASSVFRRDTEAFSGAPGGATGACLCTRQISLCF